MRLWRVLGFPVVPLLVVGACSPRIAEAPGADGGQQEASRSPAPDGAAADASPGGPYDAAGEASGSSNGTAGDDASGGSCSRAEDCLPAPAGFFPATVFCCLSNTCAYANGTDILPCTDDNEQLIVASSYDQSCNTGSDCVAVAEGNFCHAGAANCTSAAISKGAYAQYQADVAKTNAALCFAYGGCPAEFPPCCLGGTCQVGLACGIGSSTGDAGDCPAIPSSDLPSASAPANGTVSGPDLSAVLCPGGASARILSAGASYDTEPYIFELDYTVGTATEVQPFTFASPAGANDGELSVLLGLPSAGPGEYDSSSGQCGSLAFTYYLPVPPTVDCDAGQPPACPLGCSTLCSGFGCLPCSPQPPAVSYTAEGAADCIGGAQAAIGSWHLSLTSVTAAAADAGPSDGDARNYLPHGTFTATMPADGDAGAGSAALSVSF